MKKQILPRILTQIRGSRKFVKMLTVHALGLVAQGMANAKSVRLIIIQEARKLPVESNLN
jgi:hypothetical protein